MDVLLDVVSERIKELKEKLKDIKDSRKKKQLEQALDFNINIRNQLMSKPSNKLH